MKRQFIKFVALATVAVSAITSHPVLAAEELSIMASGGAWQDAQRKAWFEPFTEETGIKIVEQEYLGDLGKVKAMVDTGNVPIDLVTVETATVLQGCDAGILEPLDYSKIADQSKFIEGSALKCGVGLDALRRYPCLRSDRSQGAPYFGSGYF